jgi:hypothetical protein
MSSYDIHLDVKYPHGTLIDVGAEAAAHEPWFNQTLTQVDEAVVRLGVLEGDFHWHKHDDQDPLQGYTVGKGVVHRTRAPVRTALIMVERAGVVPTGD